MFYFIKWEVSGLCLELALKFLNQYEPQLTDFVGSNVMLPDNTTIKVNPPPGFHIMTYLCTNSDFLRTVRYFYKLKLFRYFIYYHILSFYLFHIFFLDIKYNAYGLSNV